MTGTRVQFSLDRILESGEYAKTPGGYYLARCPTGLCANLANHQVTENADGTITVSPSILVSDGQGDSWHGYLEKGIWRVV
jgi:hypothetical protein